VLNRFHTRLILASSGAMHGHGLLRAGGDPLPFPGAILKWDPVPGEEHLNGNSDSTEFDNSESMHW